MTINKISFTVVALVFIMPMKISDACGSWRTKPATTTETPDGCRDHDDCRNYEQCLMKRCTDICDFELIEHARNARCTARNHVPYYTCPEEYTGNAYRRCTKECSMDGDCADTDVCDDNVCVYGCETMKCSRNQFCRTKNHKPTCYAIAR